MRNVILICICLGIAGVLSPACTKCGGGEAVKQEPATSTQDQTMKQSTNAPKDNSPEALGNPRVRITTTLGQILLELDRQHAPITVENFLSYVKDGSYNGTIFHRVIPGFMIQGGGFEPGMKEKPTRQPIKNEAANGLKNAVGTIAMARTQVVDSATNQFFINCKDNFFLDHRDETPLGFGYAVFGRVIEGMDVVTQIENVRTTTRGMHQNVPEQDVVITAVTIERNK